MINKIKKLTKQEKKNINYNNGFITSIGLFLAHERDEWHTSGDTRSLTLYSAADHLFDIEIPNTLPKKLKLRIRKAVNNVMKNRLNILTVEQCHNMFSEFKYILKELDEYLFKKEVIIKYE